MKKDFPAIESSMSTATDSIMKILESGEEVLDLSNLLLKELPSNFHEIKKLKKLMLNGNEFAEFPEGILKIEGLEVIDFSYNKLVQLPNVGNSISIKELYLNNNLIKNFPAKCEICDCIDFLDLTSNKITTLTGNIRSLKNLKRLYLAKNFLTKLPEDIGSLEHLLELDLRHNQLTYLPRSIKQLKKAIEYQGIFLSDNKFSIPPEIYSQDNEDVINYILNEEKVRLNEAKMLLLGDGDVGKTALVNRLTGRSFIENTSMTRGIKIDRFDLNAKDGNIKINVWDFGGQEIMHAMHQFFMTKRSLYLLVCNARENKHEKIEDWLMLIQAFGGNSPVILIVNKIDDGNFEPDIRRLSEKYSNIVSYKRTSCKTGEGINELMKEIKINILKLPHLNDNIPSKWLNVKNEIGQIDKDYISLDDYLYICNTKNNIKEFKDQISLLRLLHDLGIAFNFGENDNPKETNILKPEWVTEGIYSIINSNLLFKNNGRLLRQDLNKILTDTERYPPHKYEVILDIMQKFELCFKLDDNSSFLVPDLLKTDQPIFGDIFQLEGLKFLYSYDFLPQSIMPRFIVKMHSYSKNRMYWRNGIILNFEHNDALIRSDKVDKKIYITIIGPKSSLKSVLNKIMQNFEEIHKSVSNLTFKTLIAIPSEQNIYVSFEHLLTLERHGQSEYIPEGMSTSINISDILQSFDKGYPIEKIIKESDTDSLTILLKEKHKKLNLLKDKHILLEKMSKNYGSLIALSLWVLTIICSFVWIFIVIKKGWNDMEIYTYVLAIITAIILAIGRERILPHNIGQRAREKKRKKLNILHEFDITEFEKLSHEVKTLAESLRVTEYFFNTSKGDA